VGQKPVRFNRLLPDGLPANQFTKGRPLPTVQICPPMPAHDWEPYDAHAHYRTHNRPSSEAGVDFTDYARSMHTLRTKPRHAGRKPAPWAYCDETLRELLLTYLEHRFYLRPAHGDDLSARLEKIESAAQKQAKPTAARLQKYVRAYRDADAVQLQNHDTRLLMTQRGHAELVASLVYLYYRVGFTSNDCADALSLKPPHCRQILARLAIMYDRFLAPHAPDRGLPVLRGHAARARLASRTRIRAGVGELYSVRQRLRRVETPLKLGGRTPAERRNGQG